MPLGDCEFIAARHLLLQQYKCMCSKFLKSVLNIQTSIESTFCHLAYFSTSEKVPSSDISDFGLMCVGNFQGNITKARWNYSSITGKARIVQRQALFAQVETFALELHSF